MDEIQWRRRDGSDHEQRLYASVSVEHNGERQTYSLAHAPVVLFRAEETMDKDDGILLGFRLLGFIEVVGKLQLSIDWG